jgi:hypothetical protein
LRRTLQSWHDWIEYNLTSGPAANYGEPNRQIHSAIKKILALITVANGDERRL